MDEALKDAFAKYGKPEIFNTDQGSQFTSGAWIDNRTIERLWRSLKYECVDQNAIETGSEMRAGIGKWLTDYTSERPHSTHGILTPNKAYESKTKTMKLAA